jgi:hypothetical protein
MSCSLTTVSHINDLSRIRAILLPHLLDSMSDGDTPTTGTDDDDDDDDITSNV